MKISLLLFMYVHLEAPWWFQPYDVTDIRNEMWDVTNDYINYTDAILSMWLFVNNFIRHWLASDNPTSWLSSRYTNVVTDQSRGVGKIHIETSHPVWLQIYLTHETYKVTAGINPGLIMYLVNTAAKLLLCC